MAKAVLIQNPVSIYDDTPGVLYNFPRRYLGMVRETVGDWVVIYEGRKGAFGYVGVQKIEAVVPDPSRRDRYFARIEPGSLLEFETPVPRADVSGRAYERVLRGPDGAPVSGGANTSAVRRLSAFEFAAIVDAGLAPAIGPDAMPRDADAQGPLPPGFAEGAETFDGTAERADILASRKYRDPAFERMVKKAYGGRCAISGLALRNGGGRPEVQAAHIRPVKHGGPDIVRNGLALSGTLHWMFDRGLISVAEDHAILISHNKVPDDTASRLIGKDQRLLLPENPRHHPHPEFLRYHREHIFGQLA